MTDVTVRQDYTLGPRFQSVLAHVLDELRPGGFALEFGVARGATLAAISGRMPCVGFDSFEGLPEDWGPYPKGSFAWPGMPAGVIAAGASRARVVAGWFADTLPRFDFATVHPIGLVHIDCDLYSSTQTVLEWVGPHLKPGCYVVFDEWHGQPWHIGHEERAWHEHADRTGIGWTVVGHSTEAWAVKIS